MTKSRGFVSRRQAIKSLGLAAALPWFPSALWSSDHPDFRIRTITAGINLASPDDLESLDDAISFLESARARYAGLGYTVQTIRVATQPFGEYAGDELSLGLIDKVKKLDEMAVSRNVMLNIGPVITDDRFEPALPEWSSTLINETTNTSHTVVVGSTTHGIHAATARTAGRVIAEIGRLSDRGSGNFRFAATAFSPAETPFYPAAYHSGTPAFGIGLESPRVLTKVVSTGFPREELAARMAARLDEIIAPIAEAGRELSRASGKRYSGVDTSPAPGLDASIGETIETITGKPFGSPSTVAACALLTDAIKSIRSKSCGYSGLMLPVLEDRVLAQRAVEGRFGVKDILLYSSVCGTGLDVVPLAGDSTPEQLSGLVLDVAALSVKYRKPLSARLFPVPGKQPGDPVSFDNPFLTDCIVMALE
jgi:uncharacterized protein (UPF0210 family)